MYLDYFSLDRHPFRITPDPSLFFPGGQDGRGVILNALIYGITSGEGILKVVGEVGSGKTMLCRMLEEKLPASVEIVYIANPSLSAREILYAICMELKLEVTSATERLKAMHMLQDYLLTRHGEGGTVVVFIEEAQSMPLETLEEIRLLSNLETHQHKLMQIVLFGQPELDRILAQKNIRQLRERITHSFRLEPLTTQATGDYLCYRLKAAGCTRKTVFSERAEKLIAKASSGLTRRINILADKSLLAAYADSPSRQPSQDSDEPLVLPRHVKAAIADSDYKRGFNPWFLGGLGIAALLVAVVIVIWLDIKSVPPLSSGQQVVDIDNEPPRASAPSPAATTPQGVVQSAESVESVESVERVERVENTENTTAANTPQLISDAVETAQATSAQAEPEAEVDLPTLDAPDAVEQPTPEEPQALITVLEEEVSKENDASATAADQANNASAPALAAPVTLLPAGLAELRIEPTADWLRALDNKNGYTIQMFSVPSTNPNGLEEYLQFLQLVSLLQDTFICFMPVSSPTSGRWQVMHKEFDGVTPARNFIDQLPVYIRQYGPYVRNLNGVDCSYPVDTRD